MINNAYIYIHIPLCIKKCNYCNFCSFPVKSFPVTEYVNRLRYEIDKIIDDYSITSIDSIYIGGGTPGLLSIKDYEYILKPLLELTFNDNNEFTIEINPSSSDYNYIKNLKPLGINRISLGAQSFNNNILKCLGRPHNVSDIYLAIDNIKKATINNISIDLMYGLPQQDLIDWNYTLQETLSLDIKHISAYGLKIEPDTPFNKKYSPEHSHIPDDEAQALMFLEAHKVLNINNFNHYEISNYSKAGFECKHNLNYWLNKPYLGVGLAAHSFINNQRIENSSDISVYLNNKN
ncbi:MAG: radical SAM family heme chaperone HemW, partial [Cyanobacteriota bacterium]